MPPGCRFRVATNADAPEVRELVFRVLREHGLEPDPRSTDADLFEIEAHYTRAGGCFDVLEDAQGTILGTVGLHRDAKAEGVAELRKMYLHADQRGQGLGKALLEHALDRARALGFREVHLETAAVLKAAVALYERYGFQRYEPDHLAARCDAAYRLRL